MSRASWRALRTELLRGTAPVAALATLVLGAVLMYSETNSWAARWMPFAAAVRFSTGVLAPIAIGLGVWQGGRERRRRINEQLASTARPAWQPLLVSFAAVTLGCWLGLVVVVVAAGALVAPVATYTGGGWWWLLAITPVTLAAATAVGIALGRAIPTWVAAPAAMIVGYGVQVIAHDNSPTGGLEWLVPSVLIYNAFGQTLPGQIHLGQALWFGGLAATMLVLVAARRRVTATVPAAVALAGATVLVASPGYGWEPDPVASELVCAEEDPRVCLLRYEGFLLDDVTPAAQQVLARFEGVPGGPSRAIGTGYDWALLGDEPYLLIDTGRVTITGDLYPGEWLVVSWWPTLPCEPFDAYGEYLWLADLAGSWGNQQEPDPGWGTPELVAGYATLTALPMAEQQAWIGDFIAASRSCDRAALAELVERVA